MINVNSRNNGLLIDILKLNKTYYRGTNRSKF